MNAEEIAHKVIDVVSTNLGVDKAELKPATKFQEDLGADSLDLVELIMELEEEFGIQIPQEEAEKIKTVGEATAFITKAKSA